MVEVTKLNGDKMYINEYWIELVDSTPDTTITLHSGNKVVVLEKMEVLLDKVIQWSARLRGESKHPAQKVNQRKSAKRS